MAYEGNRTLVTLIDGREVDSDSHEWRFECLARYVLKLPTLGDRRDFLAALEKRHGAKMVDDLKTLMLAIRESRKSA